MTTILRQSPLAGWKTSDQIVQDQQGTATLWMVDRSITPRFGCKGPSAGEWLAAQGLPVPAPANSWVEIHNGRIARLGRSEFLVEGPETIVSRLKSSPRADGVYPVLRQDLALALGGQAARNLFAQTCSVNFAAMDPAAHPVVLTSMVGVGVVVIPEQIQGVPHFLLWADCTYGPYLWKTLLGIAKELGGGRVLAEIPGAQALAHESQP